MFLILGKLLDVVADQFVPMEEWVAPVWREWHKKYGKMPELPEEQKSSLIPGQYQEMVAIWFIMKNVPIHHTPKEYFEWIGKAYIKKANGSALDTTLVELEMEKDAIFTDIAKSMVTESEQVEIDRMSHHKEIRKYCSIDYFKSFLEEVNEVQIDADIALELKMQMEQVEGITEEEEVPAEIIALSDEYIRQAELEEFSSIVFEPALVKNAGTSK
jgi:hypothetical protein